MNGSSHTCRAVSASVANPNDEPAKNQKLEESKNICNSIDEVIVLVRRMFATNAQVGYHMLILF